ncbi:MAG: hypothetical protein ACJA0S_000416 [Rickettsiales bacterium]|jgi:hypothetical protein
MKKTIIITLAALSLITFSLVIYGTSDNSAMPHLNDNEKGVIDGNNLDNKSEEDSQNDPKFDNNGMENSKLEGVESDNGENDQNNNESEINDDSNVDEEQTEE